MDGFSRNFPDLHRWFASRSLGLAGVPTPTGRIGVFWLEPSRDQASSGPVPVAQTWLPGFVFAVPYSAGDEQPNRRTPPVDPGESIGALADPARNLDAAVAWAPRGLPDRPTVCIASSRVGRHPENVPGWLDALRTACLSAARQGRALVVAEGMTTAPLVARFCQTTATPFVEIGWIPEKADRDWFQSQSRRIAGEDGIFPVWLTAGDARKWESTDLAAVLIADHVRILRATAGGNVAHAVDRRLRLPGSGGTGRSGRLWLLSNGTAIDAALHAVWKEQGVVDWVLENPFPDPDPSAAPRLRLPDGNGQAEILESFPEDIDSFLVHWTRAGSATSGVGTENERLDELLWGLHHGGSGALATLWTIVVSGWLTAGSRLTRGGQPVVCFTAVSLREFRGRRVFRPHLSRWDFELFGIAIRQSVLEARGCRPVIYGTREDWNSVEHSQRYRFQFSGKGGDPDSGKDWREEREWRVAGSLDLRTLGAGDCLVYVADRKSAQALAPFSRWPVLVLPRPET